MNSPTQLILNNFKHSLIIGASFSFSFMLFTIPFLAGRIKPDAEESQEDYLAAATLSITMLSMIAAISYSGLYAMGMIVSNNYGRLHRSNLQQSTINDSEAPLPDDLTIKREIEHTLQAGLLLSSAISIPAISTLFFSGDILRACGQKPNIAALAQEFLRPYSFAMLALLARICIELIALSFKKRTPLMVIALTNFVIGTVLSGLFCFYFALNMSGIAYGYLIEAYATAGFFAAYLAYAKVFQSYHFFKKLSVGPDTRQKIGEIVTRGWPIALTFGVESAAVWATSIFAGLLGTDQQIAIGLCSQFYFFALIFILACGQYNAQEIADSIGSKDYHAAIAKARYGLLATNLLLLPSCILVAAYPSVLQWISTNAELNDNIQQMLTILGPMISCMVLADATGYGMLSGLRSMQENSQDNFRTNLLPTAFSVLSTGLGIMLSYALGLHTNLDIYGIALGYAVGLVLRGLGLGYLWTREINTLQTKITEAGNPTELTPLMRTNPPPQTACCPALWSLCKTKPAYA
jgi:MATE family multidrug resistance protein